MLRRLMAQAGLNANQLADRLKVSPQLVRDWEQGRKKRLFGYRSRHSSAWSGKVF